MTSQLVKKQGDGISGADSKKNIAVQKNSSGQKTKDADSNTAGKSETAVNKIQPAVQENITTTKNQSAGNTARVKSSVNPVNELSGKNNPVEPLASARSGSAQPIFRRSNGWIKSDNAEIQCAGTSTGEFADRHGSEAYICIAGTTILRSC